MNKTKAKLNELETSLLHAKTFDAYSESGRRKIKAIKAKIKQLTA